MLNQAGWDRNVILTQVIYKKVLNFKSSNKKLVGCGTGTSLNLKKIIGKPLSEINTKYLFRNLITCLATKFVNNIFMPIIH